MRMRTRLRLLEETLAGFGCPECRHGCGILYRTSTPLPDGTRVWDVEEPLPCTRCEKIPEQIIEVITPVMDEGSGTSESGSSV
jgi:hypothetical protein